MQTTKDQIDTIQLSRVLTVKNKMGVHARPAAMIVRLANKYNDTEIIIEKGEESANAKSIMGLMMLAAAHGTKLNAIATGPRAQILLDTMEELFARKFDEA